MAEGISAREFARRDGCAHTLVNRAIKSGYFSRLPDGTLDPALVGTGWREENRRGGTVSTPVSTPVSTLRPDADEALDAAADDLLARSGAALSLAEAERLKENYLARLRQLEYDVKSGLVVPVAEVAKEVGAQYAQVRTRLLAIPAEQAPNLHRLKSVVEVQDALTAIIVEALEGLTRDGAAAPPA